MMCHHVHDSSIASSSHCSKMTTMPPPPPRRVPPAPSTRTKTSLAAKETPRNVEEETDSNPPLIGLQARIAALQLNQVGRSPAISSSASAPAKPQSSTATPPPLPRRNQSQKADDAQSAARLSWQSQSQPSSQDSRSSTPSQDLSRSLTRKPPPVPAALTRAPAPVPVPAPALPQRTKTQVPQLPQRRVPPPPTKTESAASNPPLPPPTKTETVTASDPSPAPPPQVNRATRPQLPRFIPGKSCLKCYDFSRVDNHAAMFPRENATSIQTLAHNLTDPFDTETEKARAIFTWMHYNIYYDVENFLAGTVQHATPDKVLRTGKAVCDGYSSLYVDLAEHAGLQVHKVSGHGKGYGYSALRPGEGIPPFKGNHAWNCVLMDGEWRLIDSTWGAGHLAAGSYNKRFDPSWFTSTPAEFGRKHYPEDPGYQLIPAEEGGTVSWEGYITAEPGPQLFLSFHSRNFHPYLIQPYAASLVGNNHYQFVVFKDCEHASIADADNYCLLIYFGNTREPLYQTAEGGWSATVYVPQGAGTVSLVYVDTVNNQDAKGLEPRTFVSSVSGKKAMSFQGLAAWNVE